MDAQHFAVAHAVARRHGIGADVVGSARFQVVQYVYQTHVVQAAPCAVVGHGGRLVRRAIAESLLHDVRPRYGAAPEGHRAAHLVSRVGHHGRRRPRSAQRPGVEYAVPCCLHGLLQRSVGRGHVGGRTVGGVLFGVGNGRGECCQHVALHRLRCQGVGLRGQCVQPCAQVTDVGRQLRQLKSVHAGPVARAGLQFHAYFCRAVHYGKVHRVRPRRAHCRTLAVGRQVATRGRCAVLYVLRLGRQSVLAVLQVGYALHKTAVRQMRTAGHPLLGISLVGLDCKVIVGLCLESFVSPAAETATFETGVQYAGRYVGLSVDCCIQAYKSQRQHELMCIHGVGYEFVRYDGFQATNLHKRPLSAKYLSPKMNLYVCEKSSHACFFARLIVSLQG